MSCATCSAPARTHDVTFFETDINRDGGKIMLTAGAPRSAGHDEERMLRVARLVLDRAGRLPLRIGVNRGRGLRRRLRPAVPAHLLGQGRRHQPRGPGDGQGRTRPGCSPPRRSSTRRRPSSAPPSCRRSWSRASRSRSGRPRSGTLVGSRHEDRLRRPAGRAGRGDGRAARRAGRRPRPARPAGRGRRRAGHRQVPAGRGAARPAPTTCRWCGRRARSTSRRRRTSRSGGCCATCSACLRTRRRAEVARRLVDRVAVERPAPGRRGCRCSAIPLDLELPPTRATTRARRAVPQGPARGGRRRAPRPGCCRRPTVLVVEDAHLMDDASADLLHRLAAGAGRAALAGAGDPPGAGRRASCPTPGTSLRHAAARRRWTARRRCELVQTALRGPPAAAAGAGRRWPRGAAATRCSSRRWSARQAGPARSPTCPSRSRASSPARSTGWTRPTGPCCATPPCSGMVVDEDAAATALLDDHAERPVRRLRSTGWPAFLVRERAGPAAVPARTHARRRLRGAAVRRRRLLHDQVGQTIERRRTDPGAQCELLSLHFFHAGRFDKAWTLLGARRRARAARSTPTARPSTSSSARVEAVQRAPGIPAVEVGAVLEQLGDVRDLGGQPSEALDAFRAGAATRRGDRVAVAKLSYKEARTDQRHGQDPAVAATCSPARCTCSTARTTRTRRVTRSLLATRYASARLDPGPLRGSPAVGRRWRPARPRTPATRRRWPTPTTACSWCTSPPGARRSLPYGRLALLAYEELGDLCRPGALPEQPRDRGAHDGSWVEAQDLFERASRDLPPARRRGERGERRVQLGRRAGSSGAAARRRHPLLADALRIARVVEDEELVALVLRESAQVASDELAFDRADDMLAEAGRTLAELGLEQEVVVVELRRAESLVLRGDPAAGVQPCRHRRGPRRTPCTPPC